MTSGLNIDSSFAAFAAPITGAFVEDFPGDFSEDEDVAEEQPFAEPGGILDEVARSNCLWTNPLSVVWMRSVRQRPGAMKFLPLAYAAGMVGYSLALLTRIFTVVFRVFGLIPAIFHAISSKRLFPMKEQFAHLLESTIYVGTAVVGVICPPLGYYLDAKVLGFSMRYFPQFFYGRSFYTVRGWGVSTERGFVLGNIEERFNGVSEIRNRVNARMKNEKTRFVEALRVAKTHGMEFEDLSTESMAAITELAGILIGKNRDDGFTNYIIVSDANDTKEKEAALKGCIQQMHDLWKTLKNTLDEEKLLRCLVKRLAAENDLECTASDDDLSTLPPEFETLVGQSKVFYHVCEGQCRIAWATLYQGAFQEFTSTESES